MDIVTLEDLKELVGRQARSCVSIYQPAHRGGPDTRIYAQQEPVRFKNLLREAGHRLAVFLAPGTMRSFRVPGTRGGRR